MVVMWFLCNSDKREDRRTRRTTHGPTGMVKEDVRCREAVQESPVCKWDGGDASLSWWWRFDTDEAPEATRHPV